MRTTNNAARGGPLAALLFLLIVALSFNAIAGDRIRIEQTLEWAELEEGLTGLPDKVDLTLLLRGLGPMVLLPDLPRSWRGRGLSRLRTWPEVRGGLDGDWADLGTEWFDVNTDAEQQNGVIASRIRLSRHSQDQE